MNISERGNPPLTIINNLVILRKAKNLKYFVITSNLGCMLVGEKTDLARVGKTEATREKLIESARNDLLNNSVYLADTGVNKDNKKRLVVYPAKTEIMCGKLEVLCESNNPKISDISALKIYGEIYECNF